MMIHIQKKIKQRLSFMDFFSFWKRLIKYWPFILSVCVCRCVEVYACMQTHMTNVRHQRTTCECYFSPFLHVSSKAAIQVIRLGGKYPYSPSHLRGPNLMAKFPEYSPKHIVSSVSYVSPTFMLEVLKHGSLVDSYWQLGPILRFLNAIFCDQLLIVKNGKNLHSGTVEKVIYSN